ncbi:MAG: dihydroorotate dehydrogenase electron transfer subunit [Pirellulaceae bacterium]
MSNPLHAKHYADLAIQCTVAIEENELLARDTYRARFRCPEIASRVVPGQFLMLRLSGLSDPLMGRPLAIYDTVYSAEGEPDGIDVVYLAKGKLTRQLATCRPGQPLDVWGPLGNGFPVPTAEHLIMVAGGIGQTPFFAVGHEAIGGRRYGKPQRSTNRCARVTLCYGARTADLLAGVEDFEAIGVEVRLATEDGSRGHHGLVTDVLREVLATSTLSREVVCCGPEPMLEAASKIAAEDATRCQVSLETPMACGVGICFSCVVKVRDGSGAWDYKRTCVDGPVFDAAAIEW